MKKLLFLAIVLLLINSKDLRAQWSGANPTTTNSKVGIGTTAPDMLLSVAGPIHGQSVANSGDVLFVGDDAKLVDINIAHMMGIYSSTDPTKGGFQLGSSGPQLFGNNSMLGIGTQSPGRLLDLYGMGGWQGSSGIRLQGSNPGFEITDVPSGQRWVIGNGVNFGNDGYLGLAYNATVGRHNIVVTPSGNVGIGIGNITPQAPLHLTGGGVSKDGWDIYNGNMVIQANTGTRTDAALGASLEFVIPANTDGSNPWGQGRIITVPGSNTNGDATGKMILGTRRMYNKLGSGERWYYGDDIIIDGAGYVGIGTFTPRSKFDVWGGGLSVTGLGYNGTAFITSSGGTAYFCNNSLDKGLAVTNIGNILIGKTTQLNPAYKLDVAGSVRADKLTVNTTGADFVFEPSYKLRPLVEVESFVNQNHHLPGIAPAAEMQKNGIEVGEQQTKLLQKLEEMTLYIIAQEKKQQSQNKKNDQQDNLILDQGKLLKAQQEMLLQLKTELLELKQKTGL